MPRPKIPTAIQDAKGAFKKNPSRRNNAEPRPKRGYPVMPDILATDQEAAKKWIEICKLLDDMGVLSVADLSVLANFCVCWSRWLWLAEATKEGNCVEYDSNGNSRVRAEAKEFNTQSDRMIKLMAELGLTPSSRTKVKVLEVKQEDAFLEWLGAGEN